MNVIDSRGSAFGSLARAVHSIPPFKIVLNATLVALALGYVLKQACGWLGLGDLYPFYCHSDYVPLYESRLLAGGRFPYGEPPLEYPVGLGLVIWLASAVTSSVVGFLLFNIYLAAIAALLSAWLLWRTTGGRALLFAAAPTLIMYAFLNWDLVAVACVVSAIALFLRNRDIPAACCLGVGAAIKMFPGLVILPFAAQRIQERRWSSALAIVLIPTSIVVLLNLAVAIAAFDGWLYFFQFTSQRGAEWGTIWNVACHTFGLEFCDKPQIVNRFSLAAFILGALWTSGLMFKHRHRRPLWEFAFPLIVVFVLTNKVFSPQYSLWILPWFAFVVPHLPLFLAYQATDIGIYVTSFAWQQRLYGVGGLPLWPLDIFVLARAGLVIAMLVAFFRRAPATALPSGGASETT